MCKSLSEYVFGLNRFVMNREKWSKNTVNFKYSMIIMIETRWNIISIRSNVVSYGALCLLLPDNLNVHCYLFEVQFHCCSC